MMNILDLNYHCLYFILSTLETKEQLKCFDVCERFREIILYSIWRTKFRSYRTVSPITDFLDRDECQKLFSAIAPFVERLAIDDTKYLSYISYLGRSNRWPELSYYFSFEMPKLRVLECLDPRLNDGFVKLIALRCSQVQVLHISSPHVTGKYLKNLKYLRRLYIPKCSLRTDDFEDILKMSNLTHLNLVRNDISTEVFKAMPISSKLRNIRVSNESFDFTFVLNLYKLTKLQKLEVVDIDVFKFDTTRACRWFFLKFGSQVKEIRINLKPEESDDLGRLDWLPYLSELERLHLGENIGLFDIVQYFKLPTTIKILHLYGTECLPVVLKYTDHWTSLQVIVVHNFRRYCEGYTQWLEQLIRHRTNVSRRPLQIYAVGYSDEYNFESQLIEYLENWDLYRNQTFVNIKPTMRRKENVFSGEGSVSITFF